MREIRFRARFRKISTGDEIWQFLSIEKNHICNPIVDLPGGYIQITEWEQYTGLKDAHGVEIFEGDIISVYDTYNQVWTKNGAQVVFSTDYVGGWVISNGKDNLNLGTRQSLVKVIGSVHENHELIGEQTE